MLSASPMFVVGFVAASVTLLLLFGGTLKRFFAERLEPRISFHERSAQAGHDARSRKATSATQNIFDGEVYRTEGRLREACALGVAASISGVAGIAEKRQARSVDELMETIVKRGLLPPGITYRPAERSFVSDHSTIHLRFRLEPFAVEVVSLGRKRLDGPALLLRVPEGDNDSNDGRLRYFYSMSVKDIKVPEPFAIASAIGSYGWRQDSIRAELPAEANAQQLAAWASRQLPR
ncbi:MAG: hypothetical protein MSG64_20900 [Pyrinomonadaceae bacterium MAG19_C2-C3]|nr:hypothetical protein [Pyrinomonadaceae bacterium MAG19_C2-C3]